MNEAERQYVRQRAGHRCEYCHLPQNAAPWVTFHIDHIRARQHLGTDDPINLALACPDCNFRKGTNIAAFPPETDRVVVLFNPRVDRWGDHFAVIGAEIVGLTDVGRATVRLLDMNEKERVAMRAELQVEGLL